MLPTRSALSFRRPAPWSACTRRVRLQHSSTSSTPPGYAFLPGKKTTRNFNLAQKSRRHSSKKGNHQKKNPKSTFSQVLLKISGDNHSLESRSDFISVACGPAALWQIMWIGWGSFHGIHTCTYAANISCLAVRCSHAADLGGCVRLPELMFADGFGAERRRRRCTLRCCSTLARTLLLLL